MNKYIYAIADNDGIDYYSMIAKSLAAAKEKIIRKFFDNYEWDCPEDWKGFIKYAIDEKGLIIGEPIDIETI